jgi:hypothetical protein
MTGEFLDSTQYERQHLLDKYEGIQGNLVLHREQRDHSEKQLRFYLDSEPLDNFARLKKIETIIKSKQSIERETQNIEHYEKCLADVTKLIDEYISRLDSIKEPTEKPESDK